MTNPHISTTPAMVEAATFAWLRTLWPPKASDEFVRSQIKDTDREHVRCILEATLPALQSSIPVEEMVEALEDARKALTHILGGALSLPRFATSEGQDAIAKLDQALTRLNTQSGERE